LDREKKITFTAGLDGGASKTRLRVVDVEGCLVGEAVAGPGSLTLSPELAASNCLSALEQALSGSGVEIGACRMTCGVAGSRQHEKRLLFERSLRNVGRIEVISDGYAALLGAHCGSPGGIVIVGTGSVGLRLDHEGVIDQIGGFGPVVADEGSGNWMGRNAVRAALRVMDDAAAGEGAPSALAIGLIDLMGRDHDAMLDWIGTADATRFASLVPVIIDHERQGDPLALQLVDEATQELDRLIRQTGRNGELPVAVLGGLSATLISKLSSTTRDELVQPSGDAVDGALLHARGLAPKEVYTT